MGRLVVIEGLDGAGKHTLSDALTKALADRDARSAQFAFPRYDADVHAELARDALHGRLGDIAASVHAMALLFALDRRDAAGELRQALTSSDVVLIDRYVASNAAYGAARLHEGADGGFVEWVRELEMDRFRLPVPDLQLLLSVPEAVAAARAAGRDRGRDAYEADAGLQERTAAMYGLLADASWLSPWQVVDGGAEVDAAAVVDQMLG